MKKLLVGAALLTLIGTGAMAQAPIKEFVFSQLPAKDGSIIAEVTVSPEGLHFKVTGHPSLDLSFEDIELLKKASKVYNQ